MTVLPETISCLIDLLKCGMDGTIPAAKPASVAWNDVYQLAKQHNVLTLVYEALSKDTEEIPTELEKRWKQTQSKDIAVDLVQRSTLKQLSDLFQQKQIRIMPLKGCLMKQLYPKSYMRTMGDLDIVVDPENMHAVCKILKEEGFRCESYNRGHHDIYVKPPYLNIEIHHQLVSKGCSSVTEYFKDPFHMGQASSANPYLYHMTEKSIFLFYLQHFYKHFHDSGSGIRFVCDFYILSRSFGDKISYENIRSELIQLDLNEFYHQIKLMSAVWFEGVQAVIPEMLQQYIWGNGLFGSDQQRFQNLIEKYKGHTRIGFILSRIALPFSEMATIYPILLNHSYLYLGVVLFRAFSYPFTKWDKLIRRLKVVFKSHMP